MISEHAIISNKATIGKNVTIGAFTIVYDNVVIGDNSKIGTHCELGVSNALSEGKSLLIGQNAHIRSHSIFYEGSTFGTDLETGHHVTIREKTIAGKNLRVGTSSDIQGHCSIGDYVRLHSNVFVAPSTNIDNFVWLFPHVVLTNDPHPPSNISESITLKEFAIISAKSMILPGVTIETGCVIGAGSVVSCNTLPDSLYYGNPARLISSTLELPLKDGSHSLAYPWRRHFHRGYPEEIVQQWIKEDYQ